MTSSRGAIWIATGASFIAEAERSARSFAAQHPTVPRILWTDDPKSAHPTHNFDATEELRDPSYGPGDSIIRPEMLAFDENLFLDVDTCVLGNLTSLFDVLGSFDVAARPSPAHHQIPALPDAVREINTGVVSIRRTPEVLQFLRSWYQRFELSGASRNQASFTHALYDSELRFLPLPPEFNVRIRQATYVTGPVLVLHGRHARSLARLGKRVNRWRGPRLIWHLPLTSRIAPVMVLPAPRRPVIDRSRLHSRKR